MQKLNVGICHQKIVRDKKAIEDKNNLFGEYWKDIDTDLKNATVREVSFITAKKIIEEYEWLGCMSAITWYCYGIFFDGHCGGVVCFGPEYSENLGIQAREQGRKCADWSKYDFEGKMILLNRGVCLHWTPINTNSKLIMTAVKMLPEKYKIVTATTDHLAGEVGTIYQACNFYYVGSMRDSNENVNSKNGDRDGWIIDGKLYGSRSLRMKFGDTKIETLKKHGRNIEKVKQNSKHRYFLFRGSKYEQKYYKSKIQHLIKPYPKRAVGHF
jgi:hypothetical protein